MLNMPLNILILSIPGFVFIVILDALFQVAFCTESD